MTRHTIDPGWPSFARVTYVPAVATRGGTLVFTSGLNAIDEDGVLQAPGDVVGQARAIYAKLATLLAAAGGSLADSGNPYERAFAWIGRSTPRDAVFAMDAQYITREGEDAQSFRAIAERSVLPDFSKDGGVVTNKPELAAEWFEGQMAQTELSARPDAERVAVLKPLGVNWVVLEREALTGFVCGYANEAVKVCRLP